MKFRNRMFNYPITFSAQLSSRPAICRKYDPACSLIQYKSGPWNTLFWVLYQTVGVCLELAHVFWFLSFCANTAAKDYRLSVTISEYVRYHLAIDPYNNNLLTLQSKRCCKFKEMTCAHKKSHLHLWNKLSFVVDFWSW